MESVLFGTSSFIYPSWEGMVYSKEGLEHPLREYAEKFPMVEIDRWFWSLGKDSAGLPLSQTVDEYDEDTPDGFRFIIKAPNALTLPFNPITKERNRFFLSKTLMEEYIDSLSRLSPKISLHMLQFGYLNRTMFDSRRDFLKRIEHFTQEITPRVPLGVEIRNPSYLSLEYFSALRDMNVSPVLLSGYWMDDLVETLERYGEFLPPVMAVRLHGENREDIEQVTGNRWDRIVFDRSRDVARIARALAVLAGERQIFVAVNNHFEGSAPLTILRLQKAMEEDVR